MCKDIMVTYLPRWLRGSNDHLSESIASCPKCLTLETLWFWRDRLEPTKRFTQKSDGKVFKVRKEKGVLRKTLMEMGKEGSNSFSILFISFGLSQREFHKLGDNKWVKDYTLKTPIRKEGEEIDMVTTRGFFSNEDRVFWKRREGC